HADSWSWRRPFRDRCQPREFVRRDIQTIPWLPCERRCSTGFWVSQLVPIWAKDLNVGFANINAKAEGTEARPAFREAFQRRRCLVAVDGFYEWAKTSTGKQPYAIAVADRSLMGLAGLCENWRSPAGEWVRSFAIITTMPNELCAELHNRMPVVLKARNLAGLARRGARRYIRA
ncbi:MAG: SOS response-associated peptidase, partial [Acetobacteraceae bacterium]|nr:SOS response-associated peptidase [Acetobacteraceae bacterium]